MSMSYDGYSVIWTLAASSTWAAVTGAGCISGEQGCDQGATPIPTKLTRLHETLTCHKVKERRKHCLTTCKLM